MSFGVIMFFWKDPPQTEGRRNADLLIKTSPVYCSPDTWHPGELRHATRSACHRARARTQIAAPCRRSDGLPRNNQYGALQQARAATGRRAALLGQLVPARGKSARLLIGIIWNTCEGLKGC